MTVRTKQYAGVAIGLSLAGLAVGLLRSGRRRTGDTLELGGISWGGNCLIGGLGIAGFIDDLLIENC